MVIQIISQFKSDHTGVRWALIQCDWSPYKKLETDTQEECHVKITVLFFFFFSIYLFLWLHHILLAARGIFSCKTHNFCCGIWDLVPGLGI